MGFDVCGIDPINKEGEYFRNNIWYWTKLWWFICTLNKDIIDEKEIAEGFLNDGKKIDKERAIKIAERLEKALNEKEKYNDWIENPNLPEIISGEILHKTIIKILYDDKDDVKIADKSEYRLNFPFSWYNIKKFIEFARNSGGFEIY